MKDNRVIPIFFAIDNEYVPFLSVAINSAIKNSSPNRKYKAIVLYQDLNEENRRKIGSLTAENFEIEFISMGAGMESITDRMSNRLRCDYFTLTIYFRLFIPVMFPQYDKGIYIDSDVVLLMNLKKLREAEIDRHFLMLLNTYHFDCIAPDQDYINAMCYGRIHYLPECWDAMPNDNKPPLEDAKLIHYNLFSKPWCYDGIQYGEYFWKYAEDSGYLQEIREYKNNYSDEQKESDSKCLGLLAERGAAIAASDVNFRKLYESKERKVRYYHSFTDDFVESANQNYKLPEDYQWVRKDLRSRFLGAFSYFAAFLVFSVYSRLFLHLRFRNRQVLKQTKEKGAFVYCNHTQPVGDVFHPALGCLPKRIYALASPANYGIPVIGKILPYLGALPISDTLKGMKELNAAIEYRLQQNANIVIYPEAHVWEYYTGIRPFPATSFKFPVRLDAPVYCMTTTYQKRKFGKKPAMTVYVDGPFYREPALPAKEQPKKLRDTVYECMCERSKNSDCDYIRYEAADRMK